ncbi:MAG: excinuclease ABC subunit C, partial [Myxococcota bacterium]|nr:excinuclease ABC subunit C [Myxococcota bacterium]
FNVRGTGEAGTRLAGSDDREGTSSNDDYAAMYEVLARRFRRAIQAQKPPAGAEGQAPVQEKGVPVSSRAEPVELAGAPEGDAMWDAPDLFVVDGGRGQLAVALAAAHDLGLHDLPIVGLAKERENVRGEALVDRVYLPGQKNPIPLKSTTTSLFLLARLRDEAHRFSNRARMRVGKKRRFHSPLDEVKGLGPKAKKALQTHVGNLAAIRAADDATLLAVPGVAARHVRAVRAAFPPASRPVSASAASGSTEEPAPERTPTAERARQLG